MGADDCDDIPATQPILPLLLEGVVVYVEVRSGHDNRSRGVKTQLRNLGATVVENLTNNVTHVIFNEGLPSTYKKAKKYKCHLVSVLWIEACKQELTMVSEAGYPPIGQEIYENPRSLINFKKLKSMQPDFDEEEDEKKTNQVLERIKRRKAKRETQSKTSVENIPNMPPPRALPKPKSPPRKSARKTSKGSLKSKDVQKNDALKEITPDIMNKPIVPGNLEISSMPESHVDAHDSNIVQTPLSSQSSTSSSSSVIFVGQVEEASSSTIKKKKTCTRIADAPMSRFEFMEGLNDIMSNISQEKKSRTIETSPWRRKRNSQSQNKSKQVSPRRSPRSKANISSTLVSPRRSPRHAKGQGNVKKIKKLPELPEYHTASAAIHRRYRAPLPSSPNDNFVLLSQEPGDMPSVDEMAKMRKGSILVGNEHITLSQVVRSYNAIAEGRDIESNMNSKNSVTALEDLKEPCEQVEQCLSSDIFNEGKDRNSEPLHQETSFVDVEDEGDMCDTEVDQHFGRFCISDSESTVSSVGTKVLINGQMQSMENKKTSSSVLLPDSEGMYVKETSLNLGLGEQRISTLERSSTEDNFERDPSPVFTTTKARFRRPMKKKLLKSNEQGVLNSSCPQSIKEDAAATSNMLKSSKLLSATLPSEKRRECFTPIDYINKLLPKFSRTPMNDENCDVLVEDTPDIPSKPRCETSSVVIPPTPLENEAKSETSGDSGFLNKSLNKSVTSRLKMGCKVPLFSCHSSKTPKTGMSDEVLDNLHTKSMNVRNIASLASLSPEESLQGDADNTISHDVMTADSSLKPEFLLEVPTTSVSNKLATKSDLGDLKHHQSQERENKATPNEERTMKGAVAVLKSQGYSARRSPRNQQAMTQSNKSHQETNQKKASDDSINEENSSTKLMKEEKERSSMKKSQRSRGRVITTVIRDHDIGRNRVKQTQNIGVRPLCSPSAASPQQTPSSSGYETSQSHENSDSKKVRTETVMPVAKRLKTNNFLTPVSPAPKKRSEIYESDGNTSSPVGVKKETKEGGTSGQAQRKRNRSVSKLESNKKKKLDDSGTETCGSSKTAHISRTNSRSLPATRSRSDLSVESLKLSVRKSSQEGKGRMAKSLTRTHSSSVPKIIVCTFLTASEQNGIEVAGENLDGWKLEEKVTCRTTHVISSGPKRTINMLKGMVRGCWLVHQKWMLDSSKKCTWLDEEDYELVKFSPALRQCRLRRQALGKEYKHTLFARTGPIYVHPKTEHPPAKDLRELLELCGADLRTSSKDAKIVIGCELSQKKSFQCVQPRWVLDCITANKILSLHDMAYKIK